MQIYPAALWKLLLPLALIGVAVFSRSYITLLSDEAQVIVHYLPYLFCAVAVIMAYQFNRCRLMLASFAVPVFFWLVQNKLQVSLSESEAAQNYLAISLVLPILGLYLLLIPERGIWNIYGLGFTLGFVVLGFLCAQLGPWLPQVNEAAMNYYSPRPLDGYVLSLGSSLLVFLVALVGVLLLIFRNDDVEVALLGAFLALYLTLAMLHLEQISVVLCAVAGLSLVWGLLRSSHTMAYRDELTGLPGRRALNEKMRMLGNRYAIAMLDVDHFKRFNDTHGHDVGDEVLRLVASRISRVGGGGTAYRYGGEEFCIVFPRRELEDCVEPLARVREEIADYKMSIRDRSLRPVKSRDGTRKRGATRLGKSQVSVTISAGVAARTPDYPDVEAVLAAADKQLYKAKKAGRNRVVH